MKRVALAFLLMTGAAWAADPTPAPAEAPKPECVPLFTAEEVKAVIQLFDIAVKSQGLAVAGNADFLGRKVQQGCPTKKQ